MRSKPIIPLAALTALLSACTQHHDNVAEPAANASANAVAFPVLPVPAPAMDRAALLAAVAQAASAAAGGRDDGESQRKLDGARFEVRLRFGCSGPGAPSDAKAMSWRFDEAKRTLRLRAEPDISLRQPLPAAVAGEAFEAVEGFWIPRPWLLDAGCPVVPPPPAGHPPANPEAPLVPATSPAGQQIGIAQFFSVSDSRTVRRDDRPYEATQTLAEGQAPSAEGYDLVLAGRLKRLPGGRVIACTVEQPDQPPRCIVSVDFDRVWIERPDTRQTIAEWSAGG